MSTSLCGLDEPGKVPPSAPRGLPETKGQTPVLGQARGLRDAYFCLLRIARRQLQPQQTESTPYTGPEDDELEVSGGMSGFALVVPCKCTLSNKLLRDFPEAHMVICHLLSDFEIGHLRLGNLFNNQVVIHLEVVGAYWRTGLVVVCSVLPAVDLPVWVILYVRYDTIQNIYGLQSRLTRPTRPHRA